MRHIIGIITLLLPLTATAFWDGQIAPHDGLMDEEKVARFVHQPDQWCHYQSRNVLFPDFYVGLYPGGPTQCQVWPQYPPDIYRIALDVIDDADKLSALGCPMSYPRTVYLARMKGGHQGLVFAPANDHVVLNYPQPDEQKRRATVSHELGHHHLNAAAGLLPIGHDWYAEAWPTGLQLHLNPESTSHIESWAPWSESMTWGLGNSTNPLARYHLGFFFQYLQNKHSFNLCQWIANHGANFGLLDELGIWDTLSQELYDLPLRVYIIREVWSEFASYWALGGTQYTPTVAELPTPGITTYPESNVLGAVYNVSGWSEGQTFYFHVPADGLLDFQWLIAQRCRSEDRFTAFMTVAYPDGTVIKTFRVNGSYGDDRVEGLPPGTKVAVTLASLEGKSFLNLAFIGAGGLFVMDNRSDPYDMREYDPYPHIDQTGQCVPGAAQ